MSREDRLSTSRVKEAVCNGPVISAEFKKIDSV